VDDAVSQPLRGKVALVTGGGAGIGRAVCIDCAQAGAAVVVVAPGSNGAETAELAAAVGDALWVQGDVTVSADIQQAVDVAVDRFGRLDAIVHNATSRHSSAVSDINDLTDDVFDDHIAVSLRGAFNCATAGLPALVRSKGRLVVMTSPAGIEGSAARPAYSAVKAALRGFAKSLAVEWGPLGVTVVAVSPLAMTPALHDAYEADPALADRLRRLVPLGRIGDPASDIAPVVRFLLEDGSRYITGQTIGVDGGRFTVL
jgi:3-oxoacyl-[acyl-carrier protein] reductase